MDREDGIISTLGAFIILSIVLSISREMSRCVTIIQQQSSVLKFEREKEKE